MLKSVVSAALLSAQLLSGNVYLDAVFTPADEIEPLGKWVEFHVVFNEEDFIGMEPLEVGKEKMRMLGYEEDRIARTSEDILLFFAELTEDWGGKFEYNANVKLVSQEEFIELVNNARIYQRLQNASAICETLILFK